MKKLNCLIVVLLIYPLSDTLAANPNTWTGEAKPGFRKNWEIGFNVGYLSYFGDLSIYDNNPAMKLKLESLAATCFTLTKQIGKCFGISGQVFYGGFQSVPEDHSGFETKIVEYNIQGKFDLINMIYKKHNPKTGIYGFAGAGQFLFKCTYFNAPENDVTVYHPGTPEFVYFAGGGLNYRINQKLHFQTELSIHQAQNDKLDYLVKNNNPDYYSLFTIGLSWSISDLKNPFNKPEPKAYKDLDLTKTR